MKNASKQCKGCINKIDPELYVLRGNFCGNCSGKANRVALQEHKGKISAKQLRNKSSGINKKLEEKYPSLRNI